MPLCSQKNRTLFEGYVKKSAGDFRKKPFRRRYVVITYERTVIRNVPNNQRRRLFRENHIGLEEERFVLKYYDGERETERNEVTKIFTIDDAKITDVRGAFRGYDHLISFHLCERYEGRKLLISFKDEEQKQRVLKDIQNDVRERTPSHAETEEVFTEQEPERHQPNEDTNPMRELQNFRHSINLTTEGEETAIYEDGDIYEEDGDIHDDGRFGSFCKNSQNPTDSGYSTTSSRPSVTSRPSITSRPSTSSRHDFNALQYKKTAEDILKEVDECEVTPV